MKQFRTDYNGKCDQKCMCYSWTTKKLLLVSVLWHLLAFNSYISKTNGFLGGNSNSALHHLATPHHSFLCLFHPTSCLKMCLNASRCYQLKTAFLIIINNISASLFIHPLFCFIYSSIYAAYLLWGTLESISAKVGQCAPHLHLNFQVKQTNRSGELAEEKRNKLNTQY